MIEIIVYTLLGMMTVCASCLIFFLCVTIIIEMINGRDDHE